MHNKNNVFRKAKISYNLGEKHVTNYHKRYKALPCFESRYFISRLEWFIKIAKKLSRCESIFCKKNVKRYLSLNIKIFQIASLLPWFGTWEREHAYKAKP